MLIDVNTYISLTNNNILIQQNRWPWYGCELSIDIFVTFYLYFWQHITSWFLAQLKGTKSKSSNSSPIDEYAPLAPNSLYVLFSTSGSSGHDHIVSCVVIPTVAPDSVGWFFTNRWCANTRQHFKWWLYFIWTLLCSNHACTWTILCFLFTEMKNIFWTA